MDLEVHFYGNSIRERHMVREGLEKYYLCWWFLVRASPRALRSCGNVVNPWRTKPRRSLCLGEVIFINQATVLTQLFTMQWACRVLLGIQSGGRKTQFVGWESVSQGVILGSSTTELDAWATSRLLNKQFGWFGPEIHSLPFSPETCVYPKVWKSLLLSFHSKK